MTGSSGLTAVEADGSITMGNEYLQASIVLASGPRLHAVLDKRTGTRLRCEERNAVALRFASNAPCVHIRSWHFCPGSSDAVPADSESGFTAGYHAPDMDDSNWIDAPRLNVFPIGPPGYYSVLYPGYGWYRQSVEIPVSWKDLPLHLRLGGCDNHDWAHYRVFLNGVLIGVYAGVRPWHDIPEYVLTPGSDAYGVVRFGEINRLAVQAQGLDRRHPDMLHNELERYSSYSTLADQFISAGPALDEVGEFALVSSAVDEAAGRVVASFHIRNDAAEIDLELKYWLETGEAALYKQARITNNGKQDRTLLEIDLADAMIDAPASAGGIGEPVFLDGTWFAGVMHPAGIARGETERLLLQSLPGQRLPPGACCESKTAVLGSGDAGSGQRNFVTFIERQGLRKPEYFSLYSPYGICEIAGAHDTIEFTDDMLQDNLDQVEALQERGVRFEYYGIDTGWNNPVGDLTDFYPQHFPNGPEKGLARIKALGMKLTLWVSPGGGPGAFRALEHPALKAATIGPGVYSFAYCLRHDAWRGMFRNALMHLVREKGCHGFKFDGVEFYCNNEAHGHVPGKYSVEAAMDVCIETMDEVRRAQPDLLYILYWSFLSPWWLLHGHTMYERGVIMESATPSEIPAPHLRQSMTAAQDQRQHYNWDRLPPISQDSQGVWLSNTRWASWMGNEGWQDAWILDFSRGNMSSQLWGDLALLDDEGVEVLAQTLQWCGRYGDALLRHPKRILGSPWRANAYGYAYVHGDTGALFIYNAQWHAQAVSIRLDETLGFEPDAPDAAYAVYCLHPPGQRGRLQTPQLKHRDTFDLFLQPFEVKMLQIAPAGDPALVEGLAPIDTIPQSEHLPVSLHEIGCTAVSRDDETTREMFRCAVNGRSQFLDTDKVFEHPEVFTEARDLDIVHRDYEAAFSIPPLQNARELVIVFQLHRDGVAWHHYAPFQIIQPEVAIDNRVVATKSVQKRWHEQAGAWSWAAFRIRLDPRAEPRSVALHVKAFLPRAVALEHDAWTIAAR